MWIDPDVLRLSKLRDVTFYDIGKNILFCPDCDFQLEIGAVCKPVCPDCGSRLHISKIDYELVELVNRTHGTFI